MICGFDYGTSNCAIGVSENGDIRLLPVDGDKSFMPSALYSLARELITEQVSHGMPNGRDDFIALRKPQLQMALRARNELDLMADDDVMFVGHDAFREYFADPEEGYFVKSPKSFLGASGLRPEFVGFFEDIVTAMMQTIKQRAERSTGESLTKTVIGRPVNFQGMNSEQSNQQALAILTTAAKRSGFTDVEFQYEPIAAGLSFERRLDENKTVLVVDIGGGTSDCAMVRMGPDHLNKEDRSDDFLAHTGERVGGNDLDIRLADLFLADSDGGFGLLDVLLDVHLPHRVEFVARIREFRDREDKLVNGCHVPLVRSICDNAVVVELVGAVEGSIEHALGRYWLLIHGGTPHHHTVSRRNVGTNINHHIPEILIRVVSIVHLHQQQQLSVPNCIHTYTQVELHACMLTSA